MILEEPGANAADVLSEKTPTLFRGLPRVLSLLRRDRIHRVGG
jgi:hypothetical protein